MNYAFLLLKYAGISAIVHDRTWEGLEMPRDCSYPKPSQVTFDGWQEEENRLARMEGRKVEERQSERQNQQQRVRAKAFEEIRPLEDKLKEIELEERALCLKMQNEAIQLSLSKRENVLAVWKEISAAQERINQESQSYLEDTKHVLAWNPEAIPKDIVEGRRLAHTRLNEGETVFADWRSLRSAEMPPRLEIEEAIRKGGEHLERLKKLCKDLALRYPKPKRNY